MKEWGASIRDSNAPVANIQGIVAIANTSFQLSGSFCILNAKKRTGPHISARNKNKNKKNANGATKPYSLLREP